MDKTALKTWIETLEDPMIGASVSAPFHGVMDGRVNGVRYSISHLRVRLSDGRDVMVPIEDVWDQCATCQKSIPPDGNHLECNECRCKRCGDV